VAGGISNHPDFEQLSRRVVALIAHAGSLRQVVFRSCEPTYATKDDLLSGEGGRIHGGRWNPPSSFATVYAAFSESTALAEGKANYVYYHFDPADALPRMLVAVDVNLAMVLDLTDGKVRKSLGVSATRMRCDDWRRSNRHGSESLTQALGRAGYESDLEGLVVPACDGGKNLVWFPGNLRRASQATIRNADRLR
jgi:RES domain-containing protein